MSFEPIRLPPGFYRNGTMLQSKGRWYNGSLVRFYQGTIQPEGGWRIKSQSPMTGKGRAIMSWHDNSQNTWTAFGTEQKLYAMTRGGVVSDITPVGFTVGRADAVAEGGFGDGSYGVGLYGVPIADDSNVQDASMWSLTQFGQYLNGVMAEDGNIYEWALDTGARAAKVTNSPSAVAVFTTAEGILMALGAANNPRLMQWCDQQDNTSWTPTTTNQAGDYQLGTNGRLMTGFRVKSGNLVFTDVDAWTATYRADTFVYGFDRVGEECGIISRGAGTAVDADVSAYGAQAVWMGNNGFWHFNGYVMPLECDVWDYVFSNLNTLQKSKITCEMNAAFGEIRWKCPSASSTEIDFEVIWNFRENHWRIDSTTRLCGVDAGVNSRFPMRINGPDGYVYEHEVGNAYAGAPSLPFIESGPNELGNGEFLTDILGTMPDDKTVGDVSLTLFGKNNTDDPEFSLGPLTLTSLTTFRFSARQWRIRYDTVRQTSWRIGVPKFDIQQGDGR